MNPLQSLISKYFSENNIKKSEFIKQLGFSNINKGVRRLSAFIENPDDGNPLFNKIISGTDIPESKFDLAYSKDAENGFSCEFRQALDIAWKQ